MVFALVEAPDDYPVLIESGPQSLGPEAVARVKLYREPTSALASLRLPFEVAKDRQEIARHRGTSVELLERGYSFAIEDLEDEPNSAEEDRLHTRQPPVPASASGLSPMRGAPPLARRARTVDGAGTTLHSPTDHELSQQVDR